ncbi:MAG: YigZ family protein [Chloroflexi bacterium RBG_13_56_8]|nr:MAG: YigZ family protein [Chloroflexi bacterium RBG_13_56_8]
MVKGSTFLGTVGHAQDVDAAHSFIQRVRDTYPDANHHAWAFRISEGPQAVIGSSDDGEPGGTAGRPMLAVLEGSGLREIVVVGTRYFGGIKLGSGGLVRAYTHVAREAVKALPIAERVLHQLVRITVDYAVYAKLEYLLPQHGVKVEGQEYSDVVVLSLAVPYERYEQVSDLLRELTNGQVVLEEHRLGHRYDLATAA